MMQDLLTHPVIVKPVTCYGAMTPYMCRFTVAACEYTFQLPALPKALRSRRCEGCSSLRKLPDLAHTVRRQAGSLTYLDCSGYPRLTELPELPPHRMGSIYAICLKRVTTLPRLPSEGLQGLFITGSGVVELPDALPPIDVLQCTETTITRLPQLQGCKFLDASDCKQLQQLPEQLPESLISLDCSGCALLQQLPEQLPQSLQTLCLSNCTALQRLPQHMPESLKHLSCEGCSGLQQLPVLPCDLECLRMTGCDGVREVRVGICKVVLG
jgi:hypothetical protein